MTKPFSVLNLLPKPSKSKQTSNFKWVAKLQTTIPKPSANLMKEKDAATWLGKSHATLRRIRKSEKIAFYGGPGGIRYSLQQLHDYLNSVSKSPCAPPNETKSEASGSPSAPALPITTPLGSMPGLDKLAVYHLAQATFKRPKSN